METSSKAEQRVKSFVVPTDSIWRGCWEPQAHSSFTLGHCLCQGSEVTSARSSASLPGLMHLAGPPRVGKSPEFSLRGCGRQRGPTSRRTSHTTHDGEHPCRSGLSEPSIRAPTILTCPALGGQRAGTQAEGVNCPLPLHTLGGRFQQIFQPSWCRVERKQ